MIALDNLTPKGQMDGHRLPLLELLMEPKMNINLLPMVVNLTFSSIEKQRNSITFLDASSALMVLISVDNSVILQNSCVSKRGLNHTQIFNIVTG